MESVENGTLLQAMDPIAAQDPDRLYCIQAVSNDSSQGWKNISFADLQGAVNHAVAWIQENVVPSAEENQVLAYVGANDVRYAAFVLACMRLRHTALLLSPRNSIQASLHVLSATKCTKFVFTTERRRHVEDVRAADSSIQVWEMPSLWEVFDRTARLPDPTANEAAPDKQDRIAVYIHTSGTTGLPKPLPMTNGYLAAIAQAGTLPVPEGRVSSMVTAAEPGKLLFTMSPLFHFMGLLKLVNPIYFATPFVLSPDRPLTADLLSRIIHETNPRTGAFPPSLLQELSASELGIKCLSHFDMIVYGGAPLAPEAGDRITQLTHLQSVLGSSECGLLGSLKHQDRNDWGYIEWNPEHGIEMQSIGDGLYELVVPRGDSWRAHSVFHVFPDKEEFRTGDLFVPHEVKKGLWIYNGRKDDVIVLNNGEKFNPTSMEAIIASHPFITRAMVIGQGRFQSAALVEPDWSTWQGSPDALIDAIWPVVKTANDSALGHARLMRDRIGVASREKPFKLTPKGTIQRRVILADYAGEIDSLYAENDQGENIAQIAKDAPLADVERYVSSTISDILGVCAVDRNADIFAMGFDSLQTVRLGQTLQGALRTARLDLPEGAFGSQQIYTRPTVAKLGQYTLSLLQGDDSITAAAAVESDNARAERLNGLVSKYTSGLAESHAVIITGSTGSLGSYLLSELLQDSSVARIYCLNRSADAAPRQLQSLQEKGLADFGEFPRRVEFLQASFGERRLGLDETKYEELVREVDTIIHNAWKVNFNHRVEAFDDTHIEGVRRLVELSIASQRRAHIHFVSSVSAIAGYSPEKGPSIPEVIFDDPTVPLRQGYGESKHVSERICATASAKCGIPTSIHRVGQIGGPTTTNGMWNKQEWLPSLVATSKALGKIPTSLGSVSVRWVPVDVTAKVITDIVRARSVTQHEEPSAAFHLVNPKDTEWRSLIPAVAKYCNVKEVSLQDWVQTLESFTHPTAQDLVEKPALKILDFYKAIAASGKAGPWPETSKTQGVSETLKNLNAIDVPLMENWMMQWKF